MQWHITGHAVDRYVERHRIGLNWRAAMAEMVSAIDSAVPLPSGTHNDRERWIVPDLGVVAVVRAEENKRVVLTIEPEPVPTAIMMKILETKDTEEEVLTKTLHGPSPVASGAHWTVSTKVLPADVSLLRQLFALSGISMGSEELLARPSFQLEEAYRWIGREQGWLKGPQFDRPNWIPAPRTPKRAPAPKSEPIKSAPFNPIKISASVPVQVVPEIDTGLAKRARQTLHKLVGIISLEKQREKTKRHEIDRQQNTDELKSALRIALRALKASGATAVLARIEEINPNYVSDGFLLETKGVGADNSEDGEIWQLYK